MKYEYRKLSEEKREYLASKNFKNMYGTINTFCNSYIVTEDENIIFDHIGGRPGEEYPEEYFLEYKGYYLYVYIFNESVGVEETEIGKKRYKRSKIDGYIYVSSDNEEDEKPTRQEILQVLKEVIIQWNNNVHGRIGPYDQIITEVQYGGETL